MEIRFEKILPTWWKRAAILSAAWGAIVGAMSLIINAAPITAPFILLAVIPLSLLVPAIIGFVVTKTLVSNRKIELREAAVNGAKSSIIYAIVMTAIALFFIVFNYGISAMFWGLEVLMQGFLVIAGTILVGFPLLCIIGSISGAIGGAAYSYLKK